MRKRLVLSVLAVMALMFFAPPKAQGAYCCIIIQGGGGGTGGGGTDPCSRCKQSALDSYNSCIDNNCKYLTGMAKSDCYWECQWKYNQAIIDCQHPNGPCNDV